MRSASSRGQALVEFAIITPILLFMIMGGLQVGLVMLERMRIQHAVIESAVAGAIEPAPSERCNTAETTVVQILNYAPISTKCTAIGSLFTFEAIVDYPLVFRLLGATWEIRVEESAIVR